MGPRSNDYTTSFWVTGPQKSHISIRIANTKRDRLGASTVAERAYPALWQRRPHGRYKAGFLVPDLQFSSTSSPQVLKNSHKKIISLRHFFWKKIGGSEICNTKTSQEWRQFFQNLDIFVDFLGGKRFSPPPSHLLRGQEGQSSSGLASKSQVGSESGVVF